jgi:hypothetical protein
MSVSHCKHAPQARGWAYGRWSTLALAIAGAAGCTSITVLPGSGSGASSQSGASSSAGSSMSPGAGAGSNGAGPSGSGSSFAGGSGAGSGSTSVGNSGASAPSSGAASGSSPSGGSGSAVASGSTSESGAGSSPFPAGQGNQNQTWVEFQAEDPAHATTNAQVLAPTRTKWDKTQIQAEAIGRSAVQLNKTGDYVEFTTTAPMNSIVVRYCIPDSTDGTGMQATLGLYIGGTGSTRKDMAFTSHYAWSYNGEAIPGDDSPTGIALAASLNDPTQPYPHTFFDEYNAGPGDYAGWTSVASGSSTPDPLVPAGTTIPAGTRVRIQRDAQDTAQFYIIDLVDFENVAPPPTSAPAGFTDVTTVSPIKPNDGVDHADDLESLLQSHQGQKLYFPPGNYIVRKYVQYSANAALDNFGSEIAGAGIWYTRLRGKQAIFFCDVSATCNVHDLAIWGDSIARDEPVNGAQKAVAGYQGNGTQLYDLWIEHEVAGIWIGNDPDNQKNGPTQNLHIHDVRIRDTFADGINLDNGTSGSLVENCSLRSTGDDAATTWAVDWPKCLMTGQCSDANHPDEATAPGQGVGNGNTFNHISVQMPWRANCFAAYGGYNNTWENSTCEDVLTYPGLFVDNEFGIYPFGSENTPAPPQPYLTTFDNISLVRAGGEMFFEGPQATSCAGINPCGVGTSNPPWYHGALKLYMREGDVNDVLISNITITDSTYAGIELRGVDDSVAARYGLSSSPFLSQADNAKFSNVTLKNITVAGSGGDGILVMDLETGSRGTVNFDTVSVNGSVGKALNLANGAPASIVTRVGTGNTGW